MGTALGNIPSMPSSLTKHQPMRMISYKPTKANLSEALQLYSMMVSSVETSQAIVSATLSKATSVSSATTTRIDITSVHLSVVTALLALLQSIAGAPSDLSGAHGSSVRKASCLTPSGWTISSSKPATVSSGTNRSTCCMLTTPPTTTSITTSTQQVTSTGSQQCRSWLRGIET